MCSEFLRVGGDREGLNRRLLATQGMSEQGGQWWHLPLAQRKWPFPSLSLWLGLLTASVQKIKFRQCEKM